MNISDISADDLLGRGLSPRTAYIYARNIVEALRVAGELGVELETGGPRDVARVASRFPASHSARCHLRAALWHAWELVERSDPPLGAFHVPPKPKGRCRALSGPQAERLERVAWDRCDDAGLAVLIGLYAGLRRAEIAAVAWQDFEVSAGRPRWLRVVGKGMVAADVPVHPVLAGALAPRMAPWGYLFPGRVGGHVSPATVWEYVRRVGADAGLPGLQAHVLRHTALAEAHDRSGDLRAVQHFARHAKPETTLLYTRTTAERLAAVVGMIDYGRGAA